MEFSIRWLCNYLTPRVPLPEMLERLTLSGTEVERAVKTGLEERLIVVAQIVASVPHPNADRLRVCTVDAGAERRQIVCGARNFQDGDKAPLALPGARLPGGLTIKESKLRGELSQGMLCSGKELGLDADAEGLLILPKEAPIGQPLADYLPSDTRFEVEITSNRPDLISYLGMARELAAIETGDLQTRPAPQIYFPEKETPWTIALTAPERAAFYSATLLTNLRVAPSPGWLRTAIEATGHRPINNVVDITNFVLFETGQPLHAFDADQLQGHTLHVRGAAASEMLLALDQRTYPLMPEDLVIADDAGPLALAGIMGGRSSGVSDATTSLLLEAAWFQPGGIRRTSRRLGLFSDSSYRYERRVDSGGLLAARDRAIELLIELAGAVLVGRPSVAGGLPGPASPIVLRAQRVTEILGTPIDTSKSAAFLGRLGCALVSRNGESAWQPPSFRADLTREIDLIEEIARWQGLDAIPARLRTGAFPESGEDQAHRRLGRLRRVLADRGWHECVTDALVDASSATGDAAIVLANPLSDLQTHLRTGLRASLLAVAARNLARGASGLRLFEIGRTFRREDRSLKESLHLGLLLAGLDHETSWFEPERASDLYDLSGVLTGLEQSFGLEANSILEPGPITEAEQSRFGLKVPIFYAECSLEKVLQNAPLPAHFASLPNFPPIRRDLAVVVPRTTKQSEVRSQIEAAQVAFLESIKLFDLFLDDSGERLPLDAKSLAYALTYRSPDRTLTDSEVKSAEAVLRQKLTAALGCTFRE